MKKNIGIWICPLLISGVLLALSNSCKKSNDPNNNPPPVIVHGLDANDIDGNVYHTVIIGTQTWMVENLKTTKYNDGISIPYVTDNGAWISLTTPAYCWYNNEASYKTQYGSLYNWYAVNTGKLAPTGWHVPSNAEWTTLTNYLGGENLAGFKIKESGTTHWKSPNEGATNETGFTALPGGYRNAYGCEDMGEICYFWSTQSNTYFMFYDYGGYVSLWSPWVDANCIGLSVRCIKD